MVGIRSAGAYIPRFRLTRETAGWGLPGERAVANFDEDSVTMAVAAGLDALRGVDRREVDALLFATTTAPYQEKQGAATIAEALDLRRDIFTTDVTNVQRAGTSALRTALDMARADARNVLVVAADTRLVPPKSEAERHIGDGAAAVLVGRTGLRATAEGAHSVAEHMLDVWRSSGDPFAHSGEDRFIADEGYHRIMRAAVAGLLERLGLRPADVSRAAFGSAAPRLHADLARRLGLTPEQVQDPCFGRLGSTGTAFPLMLLVGALEQARPGERILVAGYGDGADALLFQTTPAVRRGWRARGLRAHLEHGEPLPDYDALLQWRQLLAREPARRPPPQPMSVQASWRERDQNLRLYAGRCQACRRVQYPAQRVCVYCQARDRMEPWRLAERPAEVFTYSMDYVAGTPDVPLVIAVVNFEGGGRMLCMVTDRRVDEVRVGMPVEMSFRKVGIFSQGVHNYYWKAVPRWADGATPGRRRGARPRATAQRDR